MLIALPKQRGRFFLTKPNMTNKKIQMTKNGVKALEIELGGLMDAKRPKLVKRLSHARAEGDLSENSDYQNAKEELGFMDGKIAELEAVLKNAEIVKSNGNTDEVAVGANVKVKVNGSEHVFHVVGEWEADPTSKKISHTSPLGAALMGKKKGEKVEVEAPAGKIAYEIIEIK